MARTGILDLGRSLRVQRAAGRGLGSRGFVTEIEQELT